MKIYKFISSVTQLSRNGVIAFRFKGNKLFRGNFIRDYTKIEEIRERLKYIKRNKVSLLQAKL